MDARIATHPSADSLKAFGLGKLDDRLAEQVMSHLDSCADCCSKVAAQSGDDFLDRLRRAHGLSNTPAPIKSLADVDRGLEGTLAAPATPPRPMLITGLPPELVNHPQYEVLRELGRGGMGVVYLALHRLSGRQEVLKVMNKELLARPGTRERFLREIQSAAMLDHPNVVKMYTALEFGQLMVLVMEYVEGQDLAKCVKERGRLPVIHACYYAQQVALGLQHAFEKKMVHRDIKPQNLILSRAGKKHYVKVLDFGLAKVMREQKQDAELTGTGQALGTPDYMAPEQIVDAASADIRADIYSLGCTLYYLLTGTPPFKRKSMYEIFQAHHSMEAKLLNVVRPEVPEELAAVVRKMMAKEPDKRYQTPAEVGQALMAFVKPAAKSTDMTPAHSPLPASASGETGSAMKVHADQPVVGMASEDAENPWSRVTEKAPSHAWDTLTDAVTTSGHSKSSRDIPKARTVASLRAAKWPVFAAIVVGVVLIALVSLLAAGVFKVKVKTKDGILVIDVNEPNSEVFVDGAQVTVTWDEGGKRAEIRVKSGTRKVEVKKDGFTVYGEEVALEEGGRKLLTARLEPLPKAALPQAPKVNQRTAEAGFVSLFNGVDLQSWTIERGDAAQWTVEGDTIVARSTTFRTRNYLLTNKDYSDYVLHFDFKVDDGSNGGVAIRAIELEKLPLGNNLIFDHPIIKLSNPGMVSKEPTGTTHWVKSSEAYVQPVEVLALPSDAWQTMEIVVRGNNCSATVGSRKIVDVTYDPSGNNGAIVPGLQRKKGKVGFQINTGTVRFRKIEIKELPPVKAESAGQNAAFFNGKDLQGWEGCPGYWSFKDGALTGSNFTEDASFNTFLCSKKKYKDFELKFRVRLTGQGWPGNSGVQIRSEIFDRNLFAVKGPQCDMGDVYWGSLYGERFGGMMKEAPKELVRKVVKPDDFNDYAIKCVGRHVTIQVNGATTVDDDFPLLPEEGIIAWQLHAGPPMTVTFKDIEFKDLSRATGPDPAASGKVGLLEVSQVLAYLRSLNYGRDPTKNKKRQHALQELGAALTALEAGDTGGKVQEQLKTVLQDIEELTKVSTANLTNKNALKDARTKLEAAIMLCETRALTKTELPNGERDPSAIRVLQGHAGRVLHVAFSPDGKHLLSGSNSHFSAPDPVKRVNNNYPGTDNTVRLWEVETGRQAVVLRGHTWEIMGLAFCPKDSQLAAACSSTEWATDYAGPTVTVYNLASGEIRNRFTLPPRPAMRGVALSSDGKRVLVCRGNKTLEAWDLATKTKEPTVSLESGGGENALWCVAFTADRERVLGGFGGGAVRLFDASTGKAIHHYLGHTRRIQSVDFSADEKRIASTSDDGTVRVWDVESAKELLSLNGHEKGIGAPNENERSVTGVTFSQDGGWILSGGWDGTVRLWDAKTGKELRRYKGHTECVRAVAISPDNRLAASGSDDKSIRLWQLP